MLKCARYHVSNWIILVVFIGCFYVFTDWIGYWICVFYYSVSIVPVDCNKVQSTMCVCTCVCFQWIGVWYDGQVSTNLWPYSVKRLYFAHKVYFNPSHYGLCLSILQHAGEEVMEEDRAWKAETLELQYL